MIKYFRYIKIKRYFLSFKETNKLNADSKKKNSEERYNAKVEYKSDLFNKPQHYKRLR